MNVGQQGRVLRWAASQHVIPFRFVCRRRMVDGSYLHCVSHQSSSTGSLCEIFRVNNGCSRSSEAVFSKKFSRQFTSTIIDVESSESQDASSRSRTVAEQVDPSGTELPSNCWVQVNNIPPTSTLDDILNSVTKTMKEEYSTKGIIDLDGVWNPKSDEAPPMLHDQDIEHWVEKAYIVLSPYGRPTGWRLKFVSRSAAHSFLESSRQKPFKCVWKSAAVLRWTGHDEDLQSDLSSLISDAAVRVEHCSNYMTEGHCRHLFRRYDLAWEGPTVVQLGGSIVSGRQVPNSFIIRLADPSWARAALRELQGVDFRGSVLRLAQYPKQLI